MTTRILQEVHAERIRQDQKFGIIGPDRKHQPAEWLMILGEEVGEANQAALEAHFYKHKGINLDHGAMLERKQRYRKELVQIAAVAVAMIENFDMDNPSSEDESECDGGCGMHCICGY